VATTTYGTKLSLRAREAYARQQEENARKAEAEAAQHVRDLETRARNAFARAVSTTEHLVDRMAFAILAIEPSGAWQGGHVIGMLDDVTLRYDRRYSTGYTHETVSVVLACERCEQELLVVVNGIEDIGAAFSSPRLHTVCPDQRDEDGDPLGPAVPSVPPRRPMTSHEELLIDSIVNVLWERGITARDQE
jgi:hypothetical protein